MVLFKIKLSNSLKSLFFVSRFNILIFLEKSINKIYITLKKGGKIFICGNGGSAADAQHLSAEFLVRLNPNINRKPFPVISLAMDTSTLTACGNDYGFQYIFSRNLQALAKKKRFIDMYIDLR